MDDISANDLGLAQLALLVELGGPLLTSAYRSVPNKVWFGRVRVSGIIGRFLDMLAVTSINGTGIDEAAAVSLDLGDPVEGLALTSLTSWRTATIRIARNALAPDDAVDFAEKILAWIRELQEVIKREDDKSEDDENANFRQLERMIVDRCINRILVQIGKTTIAETGPSPFLMIERTIKKILKTVEPDSIPFQRGFNNFFMGGLPAPTPYTSSSYVEINRMIFGILSYFVNMVDSFPDVYRREYHEIVVRIIFVATRISDDKVCDYILGSACVLVNENPDEFRSYFSNLGQYHQAANIFYHVATYSFGGKSLLSGLDIKIVPLDLEPIHRPDLDTGINHFRELKTKLLPPDQQCLLHGAAAAQLELDYNHHYQCIHLEEHCEMRLMRFYEENKHVKILPLAYFGLSKPSCFGCNFVFYHLATAKYSGPGLSPVKYSVFGSSGKVDITWKFPKVQYNNPVDIGRIQAIKALLLEALRESAEGRLMEVLSRGLIS